MEKKREEICLVQKVCMGQNGHSPVDNWGQYVFDRSLAEAVQGIALSSDISSAVYLNFIVFHSISSCCILEQV